MKKKIFTVITTISFLFFGCASLNTTNKPEDYYSENYRRYRTENRTISDLLLVTGDFNHKNTGENRQKLTNENDQKFTSHIFNYSIS